MVRFLCLDVTAVLEPSGYEANNIDTYLYATMTTITCVHRKGFLLISSYICVGDASEDGDVLEAQQ